MPLPLLCKVATIATTWSALLSAATASNPDFSTVFEACPAPYQEGTYPSNWTIHRSIDRLSWCNRTQLLDFAVYNPLDDPATHISNRTTFGLPPTITSDQTKRREKNKVSPKCGVATKSSVIAELASSGLSGTTTSETMYYIVEAVQQIQKFLSADEQCDANSIFSYVSKGAVAAGVYIGSRLDNHGAANTIIQKFINHIKSEGISEKLLFQYCGIDTNYIVSIVINTSENNLPEVQRIVRGWTDGKYIEDFNNSKALDDTDIWIFPQLGLIELPEARSNGTSFNATLSSGEKAARGHQLHVTAACSSYKSVVAGHTCATLVTKCGITTAQFTIYNPATNLYSALAFGQIVCCSSGTVPDLIS